MKWKHMKVSSLPLIFHDGTFCHFGQKGFEGLERALFTDAAGPNWSRRLGARESDTCVITTSTEMK